MTSATYPILFRQLSLIFLDVRYPIPKKVSYHDALAPFPLVETHTNSMALERQFHKTYQRYWWLIYRGEAFWTYNKACPVFRTYEWDPQMVPAERDAYRGERNPRKIREPVDSQIHDLRAITSFTHSFRTFEFFSVIHDVVDKPSPKKRKARQQEGSRKRVRSGDESYDDEYDNDTETDDDLSSDSDYEKILHAHEQEVADTERRKITAQTMLIWLANCWSIQAKPYDTEPP
ncbi:hypothetical protein F5146DRAFT_1185087 [Armillaria mellea]|nr:hypothetical protein F5146DRAFT_1185087 [Armillaria mellea]